MGSVVKTFPVGAFLTGEEYRLFRKAAEKTGQDTGQAAKFACMFWARIVMGGTDEDGRDMDTDKRV